MDLLKLNIDGSFLKDKLQSGAGSIIRDHEGNQVNGVSHFEDGCDALLVEWIAILLGFSFCINLVYKIICESYCMDVVHHITNRDGLHLYRYISFC